MIHLTLDSTQAKNYNLFKTLRHFLPAPENFLEIAMTWYVGRAMLTLTASTTLSLFCSPDPQHYPECDLALVTIVIWARIEHSNVFTYRPIDDKADGSNSELD
jgi:hypothetical protein